MKLVTMKMFFEEVVNSGMHLPVEFVNQCICPAKMFKLIDYKTGMIVFNVLEKNLSLYPIIRKGVKHSDII